MSNEVEKHCTCLIHYDKGVPPTSEEIQKKLENKKESVKAEGLEELILLTLNGETYPKLLMAIIRFVCTSNDHRVKKLLVIYWEIVDKCREDGDLKEEMILVCNALRNDLLHANEFLRGSTLRLLCRMKYYRILEPLKEAITRNLSHRHSYVRRNAVMCVFSMVKSFGIEVMPEASEDIEQLLIVEGDLSTKRNAFLMLANCDQERAIKYVLSMQEQISTMGDIFQLSVLELVRKVCRTSQVHKGRFLRIVFNLASSSSTAVAFDCASTLVSLSSSPLAVHQAIQVYVNLLTQQSDNNVKLIVLDRLQEVQKKHKLVMEGMVMDIMRALSCPSLDVRKKVIDICLGSLVTQRNVKDIVALLKKEVVKTVGYEAQGVEGNLEYRRLLIRALHSCTAQYSEHAQSVMFILMDFLTETDQTTATEVVMFLRELIANYPDLRGPILESLAEKLADVSQSRVLRGCLWLFGEYCEDGRLIATVVESLVGALKPLPLIAEESNDKKEKKDGEKKAAASTGKYTTKTVVLADGTYGTQSVYEGGDDAEEAKADTKKSAFRTLLLGGDFLLSTMVGVSLTKLLLKESARDVVTIESKNEVLFLLVNLYKIVRQHACGGERSDSAVRLTQCVRVMIAETKGSLSDVQVAATELVKAEWASGQGRSQLAKVLELATMNAEWMGGGGDEEPEERKVDPDECIVFRQLRERAKGAGAGDSLDDDDDFAAARGSMGFNAAADGQLFSERLAKVQQMTGLADQVYVEAFLQVHTFDLVLELLVVNRTSDTLQNVLVELSTQGDLKLVDRPVGITLAPGQQSMVHASIKVGSTETGIIFGYITFDKKGADDKECAVLNELHVDILDYIERAWIGDLAFRNMWSEFEWENKININTSITEVGTYLEHIMRNTNMSIVGRSSKKAVVKGPKKPQFGQAKMTTEEVQEMIREAAGVQQLIDTSSFVAVNLYAKSIFGEDALANVSIEKLPEGKLTGSVRIRSRTQGVALSLGDRITIVQRGVLGGKR